MVLLLLLIISTFAATLVPPPEDGSDETSTSTTTTSTDSGNDAKRVSRTIAADAKRPDNIRLRLGDELALRVTSKVALEVEIPSLGEFDEVDRFAPAIFDLLPDDRGTYPVRIVESERVIARIVVSGSGRRA